MKTIYFYLLAFRSLFLIGIFVFVLSLSANTLSAQTPFTAAYNLAGGGNNVTTFAYNGTVYDGITPGPLLKVGITSSSSTNNFRGNNWPTGATNGSNTFSGSVDLGKYIQVSIDPVPSYRFTITSITFGVGRSGTGPRQWQWRGSTDSYAQPLDDYTTLNAGLTELLGILQNADSDSNWAGNELNVSPNYSNLTTTATFRVYGFNAEATTGTGGLAGNITITGTFEMIPLPVTLLTFQTKSDKNNQNLTWTYESPERFDYFEVEHSRDGKSFNALDRVSEGEIASRAYKANYTHNNPGAGIHYYRLKMVDLDGSFAYSQVIQGRIDGLGSVRPLSTFINAEGLNVSVETSVSSLDLRLLDQLGRTVYHSTQAAEAGVVHIPVSNLNAGLYYLQVNADGVMETHRLVR